MVSVDVCSLYKMLDKYSSIDFSRTTNLDARGRNIPPGVFSNIFDRIGPEIKREMGDEAFFFLSGDGRLSTPYLFDEAIYSLTENGVHVISAGYLNTTPLFEVIRRRLGIPGANITASHQPYDYNGLKVVIENNPTEYVAEVVRASSISRMSYAAVSNVSDMVRKDYLEHLSGRIGNVSFDGRLLFDPLEGVAGQFFDEIAKEKGINYTRSRFSTNGWFHQAIDGKPDPSYAKNFLPHFSDYDLVALVDPDGDRCGIATSSEPVPPPVLAALRGKTLGTGSFVVEFSLSEVIGDYLGSLGVTAVPVKRGRPNHIDEIQRINAAGGHATGGSELSLHHYNSEGVDDGIETCFEMMKLSQSGNLEAAVTDVASSIKSCAPEKRVVTKGMSENILNGLPLEYGLNQAYGDSVHTEERGTVIYHPSNNDPHELAIMAIGKTLPDANILMEEALTILRSVDPGLTEHGK